ncbi:hypothetical protein MYFR107205_27580 [Mycolicibacterium frederiksbergense]
MAGTAHPGHSAGRHGHADTAARRTAVDLPLGPGSGAVDHPGGGAAGPRSACRPGGHPVVAQHRRGAAGIPDPVRTAAWSGSRADRVHPHRIGAQERPDRDAFLPRRTQTRRPAPGQRQTVDGDRCRAARRMGRRRSGQPRRGQGTESDRQGCRIHCEEDREIGGETQQGQDRHDHRGAEVGPRRGPDGETSQGTVVARCQCRRGDPDGVRVLPVGVSDHPVGAAVRGVLLVLRGVVACRGRHPAYRGGSRTMVTRRRIPPVAVHRLGGEPVRLRGAQGPLRGLRAVRGRRGQRGAVGAEVSRCHRGGCTATGVVPLVVRHVLGSVRWFRRGRIRQFRIGAVVIDRCLHRVAVVVLQRRQ